VRNYIFFAVWFALQHFSRYLASEPDSSPRTDKVWTGSLRGTSLPPGHCCGPCLWEWHQTHTLLPKCFIKIHLDNKCNIYMSVCCVVHIGINKKVDLFQAVHFHIFCSAIWLISWQSYCHSLSFFSFRWTNMYTQSSRLLFDMKHPQWLTGSKVHFVS